MLPFQLLVAALGGSLHREQADLIAFLREENRLLKARLSGQRLRFEDHERRRLAELGDRLGRRLLAQVVTIVTPFCVGTATWWPANGPIAAAATVPLASRHISKRW